MHQLCIEVSAGDLSLANGALQPKSVDARRAVAVELAQLIWK